MSVKQDILAGMREGHTASPLPRLNINREAEATKQAAILSNMEITSRLVDEAFAGAHDCILEAGIPPEERSLYVEWRKKGDARYDVRRSISKVVKTGWLLGLEHSKKHSSGAFEPTAVFIEPDTHFTVLEINRARDSGQQPKYIWDTSDELAVAVDGGVGENHLKTKRLRPCGQSFPIVNVGFFMMEVWVSVLIVLLS